jgi:hypothetical protein
MTGLEGVSLRWDHGVADGLVTSAHARVVLDSPIADLSEGPNVITLDINPDDEGFRWSAYYGADDDAPFNEGEIKRGTAPDLAQAKRDSWAEVCRILINLAHTDEEIIESISQPPGSLSLDLDDGDDDEE